MNNYEQAKAKLEEMRCKKCGGVGILNVPYFDVTSLDTCKCDGCNGTGLTNPVGKKRAPKVQGYKFR